MKVIEDILKEVDNEVLRQAPHAQRKYNKITESLRIKFLHKIFQENKSIKKAAEDLNINYSSAKTILTMHRKKSKISNSPTTTTTSSSKDTTPTITSIPNNSSNFSVNNIAGMKRALPPKHLIKQSFMSTASNLSEQKDFDDSCSDNHDEMKSLNNSNLIKKQLIQNRNLVLVSPQSGPISLQQQLPQQKSTSIIVPPPLAQQSQTTQQTANQQQPVLPQNFLLQLQSQIQAQHQQQQQQQLQNTIQQLLLLYNALLAQQQQQKQIVQQQSTQPNSPSLNPFAQLILQQQLLASLPANNTNNNNDTIAKNWI